MDFQIDTVKLKTNIDLTTKGKFTFAVYILRPEAPNVQMEKKIQY